MNKIRLLSFRDFTAWLRVRPGENRCTNNFITRWHVKVALAIPGMKGKDDRKSRKLF